MASIQNSISLQDHMTPVFRQIMRSMDSTLKVMSRLDSQANKGTQSKSYRNAERAAKRANNEIIRMKSNLDRADASAGRLSTSASRINAATSRFGAASFNLVNFASALYLLRGIGSAISSVMEQADSARASVARLGLFNTSSHTPQQLYGEVFRTALATRTGLDETAQLTNRILISGALQGENAPTTAIGVAGIINKALVAGGGTAEENRRALLQLSQGLSSGALQGDELRSIREQTPYLARILAEGLGNVDSRFEGLGIGDLKELGAQGELTAQRIIQSFLSMEGVIDDAFNEMPRTFSQAMTNLGSIWQYFIFLLSEADGAVGKINDKIWQFVDYLSTPQGMELLDAVAMGFSLISDVIVFVMEKIGQFVVYLQENTNVAAAAILSLGVMATISASMAIVSWGLANIAILAVALTIGLFIYVLLEAGITAGQVLGAIAGLVLVVLAFLYNLAIAAAMVLAIVGAAIMDVVLLVLGGAVIAFLVITQIVLFILALVISMVLVVSAVLETLKLLVIAAFQGIATAGYTAFYNLASNVLGLLSMVATAIDGVLGSDLNASLTSRQSSLDEKYFRFMEENSPADTLGKIGEVWEGTFTDIGAMFTDPDSGFLVLDEIAGVKDAVGNSLVNPLDNSLVNGLDESRLSLGDAFGAGYDWGNNLVDKIGAGVGNDFEDAFSGMEESLAGAGDNGIAVNGGNLDSVGRIDSDVTINDEDLQLLRDISARDFLLQLQSVTPVANVSFGDVRETADVNRIMEVIENMVEEQMATSLVG